MSFSDYHLNSWEIMFKVVAKYNVSYISYVKTETDKSSIY